MHFYLLAFRRWSLDSGLFSYLSLGLFLKNGDEEEDKIMNIWQVLSSTWNMEPWVLVSALLVLVGYGLGTGF